MDALKPSGKPFEITKWEVWEAYRQVKANQGAPGVDGVTLDEFDKDLKNNLYKIWNRMSSGSYFPPPVRAVEIPKPHGGGTRILGVPTISDRVAQTVVARRLEAKVEPIFHPDSYGYRPYRSQLDAVAACRERCWKTDWVIDLDIQKFFDSVPWNLVVKAVAAHTDQPWVLLYVKRWLAAPLQLPDGTLQPRDRGTPQGSAVSPVLANLFMHYAFDAWITREFPGIRFERYADDVVVHCVTERQARNLVAAIGDRMEGQDEDRLLQGPTAAPGLCRAHRVYVLGVHVSRPHCAGEKWSALRLVPASDQQRRPKEDQRTGPPRLHRKIGLSLAEIARRINPVVRGWMNYYGAFYRSELYPLLSRINAYLRRWIRKKYKRLRTIRKAADCWQRITSQYPRLFAHWAWAHNSWWSG